MSGTKKIKLFFNIEGKESNIEVEVKRPTMAIRDKVLIEQERFHEELATINLRYPMTNQMIDKAQKVRKEFSDKNLEITETELQTKLTADLNSLSIAEMNKQAESQKQDIYRLECKLNLSIAKIIIDPTKLLANQKEEFATDIDSDFWQNTDMDEVEEAVIFFRRNNRI